MKRVIFDEYSTLEKVQGEHWLVQKLSKMYKDSFVNLVDEESLMYDDDEAIIVFELMKCDLHHAIRARFALDKIHIARKLAEALEKLHKHCLVHCDLKTANVLVSEDLTQVKICDLGMVHDEKMLIKVPLDYEVTTMYYRAPEACFPGKSLVKSSRLDMWSFGCILAELFLGRPLFFESDNESHIISIFKLMGVPDKSYSGDLDGIHKLHCEHIIEKMDSKRPRLFDRVFANVDSSWRGLIEKLLSLNPDERPSASEVLLLLHDL
jgi:serine/threonine protein kinase